MRELTKQDLREKVDLNELEGLLEEIKVKSASRHAFQKQAWEAIEFGCNMPGKFHHIYVAGPEGLGKTDLTKEVLNKEIKNKETPPDWCYVHDLQKPDELIAISLPASKGKRFKHHIETCVKYFMKHIPEKLNSPGVAQQIREIREEAIKKRQEIREKLEAKVNETEFIFVQYPDGYWDAIFPKKEKDPESGEEKMPLHIFDKVKGIWQPGGSMTRNEYFSLESDKRTFLHPVPVSGSNYLKLDKERDGELSKIHKKLTRIIYNANYKQDKIWDERNKKIRDYQEKIVKKFINAHLRPLRKEYRDNIKILRYLELLKEDVIKNWGVTEAWIKEKREVDTSKYEVNVFVDRNSQEGPPILVETNPSLENLFGKIEREYQKGVLTSSISLIKKGAMHRANGGYLIIPVINIFQQLLAPVVYDALLRTLLSQEIRIEPEPLPIISTKTLKPQPIPFNGKVILVGPIWMYEILYRDERFKRLFGTLAVLESSDFEKNISRKNYISFIQDIQRRENLKPLDTTGLARIIELAKELAEDREKLSLKFGEIKRILKEANYFATDQAISANDIEQAMKQKARRHGLLERMIQQAIRTGQLKIETSGKKKDQINGLGVMKLGDYSFASPGRITVKCGVGKTGVISVDREEGLAGPIHNKAVRILEGYMRGRYGRDKPLAVTASIAFEQQYSITEGDSASVAELICLIAALAGVETRQDVAVSGAVDQNGNILPVANINDKIKGFYEACREKGFTGTQEVIIPEANERNLMVFPEIIEAVEKKKFKVVSVARIDEAIEICTGLSSKEIDEKVNNTLNEFIQASKIKEETEEPIESKRKS